MPEALDFGARLQGTMARHGRLCVGIDPHPDLLAQWGLPETGEGVRRFGEAVVEAAAGRVGVVKPQVAFFERYGVAGMEALAAVQRSAREAGLLVISDAKRGDIGSTMAAYAHAWLHPESEFAADALTVSPFLGFGSLGPAIEAAEAHGAGLFVLALTSNPEGAEVQLARRGDRSVAGQIADAAAQRNIERAGVPRNIERRDGHNVRDVSHPALGHIGLVVGATTASTAQQAGVDLTHGLPPLLAPGYGAQGASVADLREGFGSAFDHQVLVNSSRAILVHGPQRAGLVDAIDRARDDVS